MIDLPWLDRFPDENIEKGIKVLDKVYWFIQIKRNTDIWCVYAGEALIFRTDSKETFDAFLYGLALTYISIPEALVDSFGREVKKLVE